MSSAPTDTVVPGPPEEAVRLARTAGLRDTALPDLEDVDRRRTQLWGLSLLVAVVVPSVVVAAGILAPDHPMAQPLIGRTVQLGLLAMLVGVIGYVAEREVTLRRLTVLLVAERTLTAALVDRVEQLNLVLRATRAMNSALHVDTVLTQIADSAHALLRAGGVTIELVDPVDPGLLVVAATAGRSDVAVGSRQAIAAGVAGAAVQRRDALLVAAEDAVGTGGDTLVVPLELRGSLIGVLTVSAGAGRAAFTQFDLRSLSVFGDAAAGAISNARAYGHQLGEIASLLERDRAKDEFLTLVTHELRTPLTSMIGLMATMARRGDRMAPEQIMECAGIARNQGWRLDRLIENLLESSRSLDGALEISRRPADLGREVREAVVGLQRALPTHPITVTAADGLVVEVDVDAVLRIVDNLLSNAAKYCPEGTPVQVEVAGSGSGVVVTVADSGPGIDVADVQGMFEKFTRGPDPFDRGGLGLGLYVVQALARAHGGRVEVGATPGGGTTFAVHLPAARVALPDRSMSVGVPVG